MHILLFQFIVDHDGAQIAQLHHNIDVWIVVVIDNLEAPNDVLMLQPLQDVELNLDKLLVIEKGQVWCSVVVSPQLLSVKHLHGIECFILFALIHESPFDLVYFTKCSLSQPLQHFIFINKLFSLFFLYLHLVDFLCDYLVFWVGGVVN